MLEARNARRAARGEAPQDVEAELRALTAPPRRPRAARRGARARRGPQRPPRGARRGAARRRGRDRAPPARAGLTRGPSTVDARRAALLPVLRRSRTDLDLACTHRLRSSFRRDPAASRSACSPSAAGCCGPTVGEDDARLLSTRRDPFSRARPRPDAAENLDIDAAGAGWSSTRIVYGSPPRAESATASPSSSASPHACRSSATCAHVSPRPARGPRVDPFRRVPRVGGSRSRAPAATRSCRLRAGRPSSLAWDVEHGDSSVVVMTPDASRGRRRRAQRRRRGPVPRARGLGRAHRPA